MLSFGYKRLAGKEPRCLLYFPTSENWGCLPGQDWAKDRRDDIIDRIKGKFNPPRYIYSDAPDNQGTA